MCIYIVTGGEDYDIPQNQYIKVRFPAGETTVSFDVDIIDDYEIEGREIFHVTIFDLSVPNGINLGFIRTAEIVIIDDDSKCNYTIAYICISVLNLICIYHKDS